MKVDVLPQGSITVLAPHGPLTRDEDDDFRAAAGDPIRDRNGRVVIDMSDVPYLDSRGIETLLELVADARTLVKPRLAHVCDTCREALDLTDVLEQLEVFDTVESALRSYMQ